MVKPALILLCTVCSGLGFGFWDVAFVGSLSDGASAGCATSVTNRMAGDVTDSFYLSYFNNYTNATAFVSPSTVTVCAVDVELVRVGTVSFDLNCYLMSDNGESPSMPDGVVAASADTVAASTIGTSAESVTFTFTGVELTSGTKYWVAIAPSGTAGDASNHVNWNAVGNYTANDTATYSDGSWGGIGRTAKINVKSQ